MVDYLTEIPLPGRAIGSPVAKARGAATDVAMPAFIAGSENRVVASTFGELLEEAGRRSGTSFTPTVVSLFGASGTGKTHLSRGLVRHWQQERGADRAQYVTAGDFRREFQAAIGSDAVSGFRGQFRQLELLAIDELHQLPSDEYLWQELRYTLDEYEEQGGIVLVTSLRPPEALSNIPADLRSRLASGLTLQLAAPGSAARVQILRQASASLGHTLSSDAAHRLAASVPGTASDLFGALFELFAANSTNSASTIEDADRLLSARHSRRPGLREVIAVVARHAGQSQKLLKSGSRKQSTVFARSLAVYLARELAVATYDEIGSALGGRDHTTIMHNYNKIDRDRQRDPTIQETIDELRRILLSR